MKRFWLKCVILILLCIPVFIYVQNVLHYRWPDDTYAKNLDYEKQAPDSIDVAVFGTSEMYAAYAPIVTYAEEGITGFNFAVQNRSAMTTYYQFEYMRKTQTPKIVVCDFVCLFDNALPSDSETVFRRVVDTMPDKKIRFDLIREICRVDESQDFLSWYFPVFRYHSMWDELTKENFTWDTKMFAYEPYQKGAQLNRAGFSGDPYEITPDLWEKEHNPDPVQEFSMNYYDRMIAECKDLGIQVVCILPPKVSDASVYRANWPAMEEYFASRGVIGINYNTYEQISRMGLKMDEDFANDSHLNANGSVKFSKVVAEDLRAMFPDLPDRRLDERVALSWDTDVEKSDLE